MQLERRPLNVQTDRKKKKKGLATAATATDVKGGGDIL